MKYEAYYLIKPRAELIAKARNLGSLGEMLQEPVLWLNRQGGRTTRGPNDHTPAIKKLFLLRVMQHARAEGIEDALGLSVSIEAFDLWWTLEFFPGYDDYAADILQDLENAGELSSVPLDEQEELRRLIQ